MLRGVVVVVVVDTDAAAADACADGISYERNPDSHAVAQLPRSMSRCLSSSSSPSSDWARRCNCRKGGPCQGEGRWGSVSELSV